MIPADGTIGWVRAWYDPRFVCGHGAFIGDQRVKILSARPDGRVAVRVWNTGERLLVTPREVHFND